METFVTILLWLHFLGLAAGLGGGIALSQTGPKLRSATQNVQPTMWELERIFSLIASIGVGVLLVTGPLMVWLRYGGFGGMPLWFWAKLALVLVVVVAVGAHHLAGRRFQAGDTGAYRWMEISGRTAGLSMVLVVLFAVLAFG